MIICEQEFRRAIQAMPVRELELPLWDTAKAEGRVLQQVKRRHRDRMELERYMRIADDFVESQRYESLESTTNRWNRRRSAAWPPELSRGRGIRWPMANSWCSRTPRGYTSPRQKKFIPTGRQPPVEQFPLVSAASRYNTGSPSNLGGGRMLRGGPEQEHGKFEGEEAEEQRRIDLSAGSRYRGQQESLHLQEGSLVLQGRVRGPAALWRSPRRRRERRRRKGQRRQRSRRTRTIFQMTTTRRSQDMTPTCSRSAGKMTFRLRGVR
jgi:hypothetical protein